MADDTIDLKSADARVSLILFARALRHWHWMPLISHPSRRALCGLALRVGRGAYPVPRGWVAIKEYDRNGAQLVMPRWLSFFFLVWRNRYHYTYVPLQRWGWLYAPYEACYYREFRWKWPWQTRPSSASRGLPDA